jgi:hypothetical protein
MGRYRAKQGEAPIGLDQRAWRVVKDAVSVIQRPERRRRRASPAPDDLVLGRATEQEGVDGTGSNLANASFEVLD